MTCAVYGCEAPSLSRGWCGNHYSRWRHHGDPLLGRKMGPNATVAVSGNAIGLEITDSVGRPVALALVDSADYPLVREYRWARRPKTNYVFASRGGHLLLHRMILPVVDGGVVDHINGDPLDNRRANLRLATMRQNSWNVSTASSSESGRRGVRRQGNRWTAGISVTKSFRTLEEAIAQRETWEKQVHGEFLRQETNA